METGERVTFTLEVQAKGQRVSLQHLSSFVIQLATCRWPSSLLLMISKTKKEMKIDKESKRKCLIWSHKINYKKLLA